MISRTVFILAVALPLVLCLLALLATCAVLLLRLLRCRGKHQADIENLRHANNECAKLEKKLATFPKALDTQYENSGFSQREVLESFMAFYNALESYTMKWIGYKDPPSPSDFEESAARIEALLFPTEPPPKHFLSTDKDTRVFPNPHQYTSEEICAFLKENANRASICHYIIGSVLLKGISIDGNPLLTLLPLDYGEVYALDKLYTLIRGAELFHNLPVHISRFGIYHRREPRPGEIWRESQRKPYIALFESLFDPYFTTKTPAAVTQRQQEFETLLDTAMELGMKIIGHSHNKIEFRWGPRNNIAIMVNPKLRSLKYKAEKLEHDTQVCESISSRVWRD